MNLIGIVEAVYQRHTPEQTWLAGIAEAACGYFRAQGGALVWSTRETVDGRAVVSASAGVAEPFADALLSALRAEACEREPTRDQRVATLAIANDAVGCAVSSLCEVDAQADAFELLLIEANEPGWQAIAIAVPLGRLGNNAGSVRGGKNVAQHLRAGLRLRRLAHERELAAPHRGADLTGQDHLGEAPPRASLNLALLSTLERDMKNPPDQGETAHRAWNQLVDGELVCCDGFDAHGYRHIVLQPASDPSQRRARLTWRQRLVLALRSTGLPLKVVATELGVSTSTVAYDLALALQRLGVRSANDLSIANDATLQFARTLSPTCLPKARDRPSTSAQRR